MITKERFMEIWNASTLPKHYQRMDDLACMGFSFDENGDMHHWESKALHEWLDKEEETVVGVGLSKLEKAKKKIFKRAKELEFESETVN